MLKKVFKMCVLLTAGFFVLAHPDNSMSFGKNKVTYKSFDWKKHSSDHFDFYYYPSMESMMPDVIRFFESSYARISSELGFELSETTPVILYQTHLDFQQTNIISGFIPYGVAGFSEPIKRRIVIPVEGPKKELETLITHELVHTFEFEILFQNRFNKISPVPIWIMEGLSEHIANDWNSVGRMVLRDAVLNGYLPDLDRLESFDSLFSPYLGYKAAQSAIDFIQHEFGIEKLRTLLWEMRKTLRSPDYFNKSVQDVFGISIRELSIRWMEDLRRRFIEVERRRESSSKFDTTIPRLNRYERRFSPVFTPGGKLLAYIHSGIDGMEIYLDGLDQKKKEPFMCLTCELDRFKHKQIVMDGRPLHGNPWSDYLVYISQRNNNFYLNVLDPVVGGLTRTIRLKQDQTSSPSLSPDGTKVAYAGYENTKSDIFIINLETEQITNITNDIYVDETPSWSPDGEWIAFATERDSQFDLFRVNIETKESLPFVLSPGNERVPSWSPDGTSLLYTSDRIDGIDDVYIEDVSSGEIRRLTAAVTGMFCPSFSEDSQQIAASFYFDATQNIVTFSSARSPQIPESTADAAYLDQNGEMIAFPMKEYAPASSVPSNISELQNDKVKFRLIPDAAIGTISYGTEGDFTAEGGALFSDILGDHQFELIAIRRGNRNGILGQYLFLRNRIDYGIVLNQDSDYYYLYDVFQNRYLRVDWDYYAGMIHAEYPLTTFYRTELDLGYFERRYSSDLGLGTSYDEKLMYVEPAISGDTVIARALTGYAEAYSGHAFRFSVRFPIAAGTDYSDYVNTYFDYRHYLPISRRSLLAFREWGIVSTGEDAQYFGVGGFGTIRGYDYNSIVGNKVAITNFELRFPLVDQIVFAGGIGFYGLRGKLFADAGAVWRNDEDPEWKFDDPKTELMEGNIFGSAGFGFNFWMIGVEWHFEWSRKTDFKSFGGDWVYQWSIRRSF